MSNIPNNISQLEKIPKYPELITPKENLDVAVLEELYSSLASITPEKN